MFSIKKILTRIVPLSISLMPLINASVAFATAAQFVDLCKTEILPEDTQTTFTTLKRFAFGFEVQDPTCEELVTELQKLTSLSLPGQSFHYYDIPDLTPISLLDWVVDLSIPSQRVESLRPLSRMNLTRLDVSGISADHSVLSSLTNLKDLSMTFNDGEAHPAVIQNLDLDRLTAYFSEGSLDLSYLPISIQTLNLTGQGLKSLNGLGQLYRLDSLNIEQVKLKNLSALESIRSRRLNLTIRSSEIASFAAIKHLKYQTELAIQYTNLKDLTFLSSLTELRKLELDFNKIQDVSALSSLKHLELLNLGSNEIGSQIVGLEGLVNLRSLYLNHNRISYLRLGNWPKLEVLELTKNYLLHGPQLSMEPSQYRIKELGLGLNELRVLDAEIGKIKTIQVLGLSRNKLINLDAVSNLENLRILNIADNKLVDLSPLEGLKRLEELTYYDNPLSSFDCPVQPSTVCRN